MAPRPTGTRQEILSTALDLFLAQGYEATSLREIAERLEITKAALYYHFPAKEQLAIELSREFLNEFADLVAQARTERRVVRETFRAELLSAYLHLLVRHHRVIDLLSQNPATANHPDVGRRALTLVEALTNELAGPDAKKADRLRVACAIGAINSVATHTSLGDAQGAEGIILGAALAALDALPLASSGRPSDRKRSYKPPLTAI